MAGLRRQINATGSPSARTGLSRSLRRPKVSSVGRARRKIGPLFAEETVMDAKPARAATRGMSREFGPVGLGLIAAPVAVAIGALLASALPEGADGAWMMLGSYLAPAALA